MEHNIIIDILFHAGTSYVGELPTLQHRVSGEFHIRDEKTLEFIDFNYDGQGPGNYCTVNTFNTIYSLS